MGLGIQTSYVIVLSSFGLILKVLKKKKNNSRADESKGLFESRLRHPEASSRSALSLRST
uniref:Uncharacterized protein n=1 Tax=Anguilla anguilla TaxID=7936 RepID=A0A0E9SSM2_ANGAN